MYHVSSQGEQEPLNTEILRRCALLDDKQQATTARPTRESARGLRSTPVVDLADNPPVSFCLIGGLVIGVWAMLSIVGNEHVRRSRELERKYALPPLPPPPVDDQMTVLEA